MLTEMDFKYVAIIIVDSTVPAIAETLHEGHTLAYFIGLLTFVNCDGVISSLRVTNWIVCFIYQIYYVYA